VKLVTQKEIAAVVDVNPSIVSAALFKVKALEMRGREKLYNAEEARAALVAYFEGIRDYAVARAEEKAALYQRRIDAARKI
jgi:hypothetical protein